MAHYVAMKRRVEDFYALLSGDGQNLLLCNSDKMQRGVCSMLQLRGKIGNTYLCTISRAG